MNPASFRTARFTSTSPVLLLVAVAASSRDGGEHSISLASSLFLVGTPFTVVTVLPNLSDWRRIVIYGSQSSEVSPTRCRVAPARASQLIANPLAHTSARGLSDALATPRRTIRQNSFTFTARLITQELAPGAVAPPPSVSSETHSRL